MWNEGQQLSFSPKVNPPRTARHLSSTLFEDLCCWMKEGELGNLSCQSLLAAKFWGHLVKILEQSRPS